MAPPNSHRVEDIFDEDHSAAEGHRDRETQQDRPSHSHPRSSQHYPGYHYGMPPYYGSPVMYYPGSHHDPHCHYCPSNYGYGPQHGHNSREQLAHYHPPQRDATVPQPSQQTQPMQQSALQPHYVAVNVQNDVSQAQHQAQNQAASNKQISLKEKVITNTTRALDSILDRKVLLAALTAFLTPRLMHHMHIAGEKKKRKGITLNLGFGGF